MSTRTTRVKHEIINRKEKINAVLGAIRPEAMGISDLNRFS